KSRLGLAERFTSSSDEIAQFAIDLWPPSPLSRFPTPERREARAVPAKDGLRLNNVRRTEQARPEPGHPDQREDAESEIGACLPERAHHLGVEWLALQLGRNDHTGKAKLDRTPFEFGRSGLRIERRNMRQPDEAARVIALGLPHPIIDQAAGRGVWLNKAAAAGQHR